MDFSMILSDLYGLLFFLKKGVNELRDGLDYFKKVYDEVPEWVQKMHDYKPEILNHYTALRGTAMEEGVLSVKIKDSLLVGINGARQYVRSMIYHTKGAIDGGTTLEELAEYLVVGYLVGGEKSLQVTLQSFEYAAELLRSEVPKISSDSPSVDILRLYAKYSTKPSYFEKIAIAIEKNQNVEEIILASNTVSIKIKYLLLIGCYSVNLLNKEVVFWTEKAREKEVKEEELAELGFICLLTAGIPAWFEISDALL